MDGVIPTDVAFGDKVKVPKLICRNRFYKHTGKTREVVEEIESESSDLFSSSSEKVVFEEEEESESSELP